MKLPIEESAISGKGTYAWMKKPFLWLALLYTAALLALLRANYSYIDDLGRVVWGYRGWLDWSRYMSTVLSIVIHPTFRVSDLSPLPQLLAVAIMSISGLLAVYAFTGRKEIRWPFLLAALPMGLSPWFLDCFSYKFDAPYIAVSVLASVVPFLWWEKSRKKFLLASFLGLLMMITTYQAASGIFVIETLFLAFFSWIRGGKGKEIFSWMCQAAAVYIFVLLLFRFTIQKPASEDYVLISTPPLGELPFVFCRNISNYLHTAMGDLNWLTQLLFGVAILFFFLHIWRVTKKNHVLTLLMALVLLLVTAVLSYGAYLVLEKPLLYPRGLLGMGVWLSFVLISLITATESKGPSKWLVLLLAWQLITGATAYGNALAEQKQYTDFRVQLLIQDLNNLHLTDDEHIRYYVRGDMGKAPAVRNAETGYPALKRLVTPTMAGRGIWEHFYFFFYHDLGNHAEGTPDDEAKQRELFESAPMPVVLENTYHRIESDGKTVVIRMKPSRWDSMYAMNENETK